MFDLSTPYLFGAGAYTAVNAETDTLIAAMSVPPPRSRKILIDNFIGSLKSASIWTKIDVMWVLAAHDEQAGRLNWKSPGTYTLTAVNSPAFTTDRGFTGNGSSAYLNTGFVPSVVVGNFARDSAHLGAWNLTEGTSDMHIAGLDSGAATSVSIIPRSAAGNTVVRINDGTNLSAARSSALGHFVANRSGASAKESYQDGASIGSAATASTALADKEIFGLRHTTNYSSRQMAALHAGSSLSSGDVAAVHTALNDYLVAVGAI